MSKVSVIMPAFNASNFIKDAIESILAQSLADWELLILDDASTDNTFELASSFDDPRISITKNNSNEGYLKSCNRLFGKASGEYITFLDADDTCSAKRLEICKSAIEEKRLDFVTTNFSKLFLNGSKENIETKIDYKQVAALPTYIPTICGATIFAKTDLLKKIGGYHPVFDRMGAEDYHLLFRLSRNGTGIHLPADTYSYRQHENQIRNQPTEAHFIAHDLDITIRKSVLESNLDLLLTENSDQLEKVKAELLTSFTEDSTLMLRYRSIQSLNANNWSEAISIMYNAISIAPTNMANWQRLFYLLYVICRRRIRI